MKIKNKIPDNLLPLYRYWLGEFLVIVAYDPKSYVIENYYFQNSEDKLPIYITIQGYYYRNLEKL